MSTIELPPEPTSPGAARRFVTDDLAGHDGAPTDVAALLVSELVTNAVVHARTPIVVTVTATNGLVRVGVRDGSPTLPALRRFDRDAAAGRGLQLVERLASRWGIDVNDASKTVWFEVPLAPASGTNAEDDGSARSRRRRVASS